MDKKKKKEKTLPVSVVLTKPITKPITKGKSKAGLPPRGSGISTSVVPAKKHPPPPSRLPAEHFKRAKQLLNLADMTPLEDEMDFEEQNSEDVDPNEDKCEEDNDGVYFPVHDEDDDEDDDNTFDHNDTMSEDDFLGSRQNDEVEQESLHISSGEDKESAKAKEKEDKGSKECIENSPAWEHFEKVMVHTKEDPKGPKVLKARCNHCTKHYAYIEWAFNELYEKERAQIETEEVRNELFTLFEKFDKEKKLSNKSAPSSSKSLATNSMPASDGDFLSWRSNTVPKASKSELRNYLEDPGEENGPQFDLLEWWKVNSLRYPVLAKMARRFLTIPASSVSSESTFSTGGRVLDDYRSSLKPEMVEALVCGASYIKGAHRDLNLIERDTNDAEEDMETIVLPTSVVHSN